MTDNILTAKDPVWHNTRTDPPRVGAIVEALHIGGTYHKIVWQDDFVHTYVGWKELPKVPQELKEELWLAYTGERSQMIGRATP